MRRLRVLLAVMVMQMLCWSAQALAQSCTSTAGSALPALTDEQFFARPIGAVALGSDCNERARRCAVYYDFSACTAVSFPAGLSGKANRLVMVFNTLSQCGSSCEWVDSVLQTIVLYPPEAAAISYRPFVDLFRNYSDRWAVYAGRSNTRLKCCEQAPGEMLQPADYLAFDGRTAAENLLYDRTHLSWHSAFSPSYRQEGVHGSLFASNALSASDGQPDLKTWTLRDYFVDAMADCPGCSAKLMMTRFQATEANETVKRPATPLFQAFNVMTYKTIRVSTRAPMGEGVYDTSVTIDLLR